VPLHAHSAAQLLQHAGGEGQLITNHLMISDDSVTYTFFQHAGGEGTTLHIALLGCGAGSSESTWFKRVQSDTDPESFLSSHSIVQAIEAADEFFSACSSDVSHDNEIFHDVSPPYEPLVGS
jgi:hypothetical protein